MASIFSPFRDGAVVLVFGKAFEVARGFLEVLGPARRVDVHPIGGTGAQAEAGVDGGRLPFKAREVMNRGCCAMMRLAMSVGTVSSRIV